MNNGISDYLELKFNSNIKISILKIADHQQKNKKLIQEYQNAESFYDHSHWIAGRWENTYCPISLLPTARKLFQIAVEFLESTCNKSTLIPHSVPGMENDGFWFNHMPPGSKTGLHDHKSGAFLSGVYYIKVPENSGNIVFQVDSESKEIISEEGKMILFPPSLKHQVHENQSNEDRISLAFNLYALPL